MVRNPFTGLRGLGFWSYGIGGGWGGLGHEVVTQPHDLAIVRESILSAMREKHRDFAARLSSAGRSLPHHHETVIIPDVASYVKESGDLAFLDETVPWKDGGVATVFDVLSREIDYALLALDARGLPRIPYGVGDWNDELNFLSTEGRAESVMMAEEYCFYLRESSELARRHGRLREAENWMSARRFIKDAVNTHAWDGEWYIRAFSDGQPELAPVGSSRNAEGRIHLNAQSWAVLSGVAEGDRLRACMDSVEAHLMSDFGPLQSSPPYTEFDPHIGTLTKYAPGWRQGCVYLRPAGWAVMAACVAGRADLAWRMYRAASITNLRRDVERFECEPYAYPEVYVGPTHRLAGRGQYQWNLGEGANWMWRSYVYYILGIRPTFDGLLADPQIPSAWKGFRMTRSFRGARYCIDVRNPSGLHAGVKAVVVDGTTIPGNTIPALGDGKTHDVSIVLAG
jgi:cellobiose phosphorylase